MTCKCNTAKRDPDCTTGHGLSELLVDMAFPGLDRGPEAPEPCEDCDGTGRVPFGLLSECPHCLGTGVQPSRISTWRDRW